MLRLRLVNGLIIEVAVGEIEITSYKKLAHFELFNPSSNFRGNYIHLAPVLATYVSIWYP